MKFAVYVEGKAEDLKMRGLSAEMDQIKVVIG